MLLESINELSLSNKMEATYLLRGYRKQRRFFFDKRIQEINTTYSLKKDEEEALWGYLLAAEELPNINRDHYPLLPELESHKPEQEFCDENEINFAYLGWLLIYWSIAWRKYALSNKEKLSTRFILNKQKITGDKTSFLPNVEDELIKELKRVFPEAENEIGVASKSILNNRKVSALDKKTLKYFKQHSIGSASRDLARNLEKIIDDNNYNPSERIRLWRNPLHLYQLIAACRWLDHVKKYVHAVQDKPTALTAPIFQQIKSAMVKGNSLNENGDLIINAKGSKVARFDQTAYINVTTAQSMLRSGIPLLSSLTAHKIVRWLLMKVHKQFLMDEKEPRKLSFPGGYPKLAEFAGIGSSDAAAAKVRKIIMALSGCIFQYKTNDRIGEGNLLVFRYERAIGRNKSSFLEIEMQPLACPGFVNSLPLGNIEFQEQRQLIPVVSLPPFISRDNEHAAQATFQFELLIEMRLRAKEIYEKGGVYISDSVLANIAQNAEMHKKHIDPLLKLWVKEGYLTMPEPNFFNLGERYSAARKMITQAGEREFLGAMAGKKQKLKKNKSLKKSLN